MPLNVNKLKNELVKVCDRAANGEDVSFVEMADAIEIYAMDLQYPPPAGVSSGIASMKSVLKSITFQMGPTAPAIIGTAFIQLGVAISSSVPVGGSLVFPTLPPIGPPNLAAAFAQPQDAETFATNFSTIVDTWMRTGQYDSFGIPAAGTTPPIPVPTPWM